MKRVLYAGSFDPITNGHIDVIKQASKLFDEVLVAVANNSQKNVLFSVEERKGFIEKMVDAEGFTNVKADAFEGLTVEFAKKNDVNIIIRGLRAISDFDVEFQMALTNRKLNADIETVFLMSSQDHFYLSSHLIKEIVSLEGAVNHFVPPYVEEALKKKYQAGK